MDDLSHIPSTGDISILERFVLAMIEEDICPTCLGWLKEQPKCRKCGYDVHSFLNGQDSH